MRRTLRNTAILALPSLINAVALSNLTPRASNLPDACENIYTAQIPGCESSDFITHQCTSTCISSLQALVSPIEKACGGQGVSGQNLVVAFLAGVGPAQICHNIGTTTTTTPPTTQSTTAAPKTTTTTPTTSQKKTKTAKPIIGSSTSTASTASEASSLLVDTSSSSSAQATNTRRPTKAAHTTEQSSSAAPTESSATSSISKSSSSKTTTSAGNSQTDLSDGSGGGSPFDTEGNLMNGAPGITLSAVSLLFPALAAAALLR